MTIGIIMRPSFSESGHKIWVLYNDFIELLNKYNVKIFPINQSSYNHIIESISACNGVILQGGDITTQYDSDIIKYLYNHNIPALGICLGMQEMGKVLGGKLVPCQNHYCQTDYAHFVKVDKNSQLYDIVENNKIMVNSRHKFCLNIDKKYIAAVNNGVVEAIEDRNKKFFIGIQWHPESLWFDKYSQKIFTKFITTCQKNI